MNVFAKFDEIPSMLFQEIKETKCYGHTFVRSFRRTDKVKTVYPPTNTVCGGYNYNVKRSMDLLLYCYCPIMLTCPCNVDSLTPHFYIEKVGFTRVYIFFLFLLQNIDCGYSLEPPIDVLSKNKKDIKNFHLIIIIFTAVKYCSILHGHVCVMGGSKQPCNLTIIIKLKSLKKKMV